MQEWGNSGSSEKCLIQPRLQVKAEKTTRGENKPETQKQLVQEQTEPIRFCLSTWLIQAGLITETLLTVSLSRDLGLHLRKHIWNEARRSQQRCGYIWNRGQDGDLIISVWFIPRGNFSTSQTCTVHTRASCSPAQQNLLTHHLAAAGQMLGTLSRAGFENTHQLPSFSLSVHRFIKSSAAWRVNCHHFNFRKRT